MPRRKIPLEYDPDVRPGHENVQGAPITEALAMLHRSSIISEEVLREIAALARRGYTAKAIAAKVGIGQRTLTSWVARGAQRRHELNDWMDRRASLPVYYSHEQIVAEIGEPPIEDDMLALHDAFSRAEADSECELVDVIVNDAVLNQNTGSAKWMLTNRHGWGGKNNIKVEIDNDSAPDMDVLAALDKKITDWEVKQKALTDAFATPSEPTQT
jgi:transposase-like protein